MPRHRKPSLLRLPFWVLIAAWVCANTPPGAVLQTLHWVRQAQHFSHQEHLRGEVAALLSGETASTPQAVVAAADEPREPYSPPAATEAGAKKMLLSCLASGGASITPPAGVDLLWPGSGQDRPSAPVADVPHPPPRTA